MNKVTGMAKSSARGGFKMFLGVAISSVITAVSVIFVMNLLDTSGDFGLVGIALIFPSILSLFKDWGINSGMVKYLAQYNSEKDENGVQNVLVAGLVFELITGSLLTLLCYFMAGFLATSIFEIPEAQIFIEFASLTIIADSLLKISQSSFLGLERLEFHSLTQILNAVIRATLAPLLVWLNFGVLGAIQGQIVGQLASGVVGLLIFYVIFLRRPATKSLDLNLDVFGTIKHMLKYSIPLSVSVVASGFLPHYYNTLLRKSVVLASENAYEIAMGNYNAASGNFAVIITFFTVPLSAVLFPAFSKLKADRDKKPLQVVFQSSVKYSALLAVPVTIMVMVLAEPLVFALVKTSYADTPLYLTLYSIIFLYVGIGKLSVPSFLNGQGKTNITMKMALLTLALGLLLSYIFIIPFGVIGLIITNITCGLPSMIYGIRYVRKNYGAAIDYVSSAKIFLASCVAAVVTYLLLFVMQSSYWTELIVGGVCFLSVYLVTAPLIKAVDKKDVHSLREMLSGLGPFSYIFNIPLQVIEKLSDVF